MPAAVGLAARAGQAAPKPRPTTPGVINAPALLAEVTERVTGHAAEPHIINLSLLPFGPEDAAWLDQCLGRGRVTLLSRGYGNCRITATGLPNTWWVQYFNSMDQRILNTLEVTQVPEAALAAREDYEDSIERLKEWIATLSDL